jgi:hypothetical protein
VVWVIVFTSSGPRKKKLPLSPGNADCHKVNVVGSSSTYRGTLRVILRVGTAHTTNQWLRVVVNHAFIHHIHV